VVYDTNVPAKRTISSLLFCTSCLHKGEKGEYRVREGANMTKESDILKIVKENILRILGERKGELSLQSIKAEVKVSPSFVSKAIKALEEKNLIQVVEKIVKLTKNGQNEAKDIVKKHLLLENYFKKTRNEREAHKITDILEHYVSMEVIDNIKKISTFKKEGIPLTKLELNKKGIITDIIFSDYGLFERMISMGIFLGEKIRVMYEISDGIVVNVGGKKIALGKDIAKEIEVLG